MQTLGIDTSFSSSVGPILAAIAGMALVAAWVILAASRFVQGGTVERPERVPQLYGYTVCLIALIWGITSVIAIVDNALTMSAPEMRGVSPYGWEPSVSSFEAFRSTYDRSRQMAAISSGPGEVKLDSVPEGELRKRYEGLRADLIARGRFEAQRNLIIALLSLVIAAGVFVFHWRWLKRNSGAASL